MKKLKYILLSIIAITSVGVTTSCETPGELVDEVVFERRLWNATTSDLIQTDDNNNKWTYSVDELLTGLDGTIQLRNDGDYIESEAVDIRCPFTVDITMSLNGGGGIVTNVEKDEFIFEVQAINARGQVVDSQRLDELKEFPAEHEMAVKSFQLNANSRHVKKIRFVLVKAFLKSFRFNRVGLGRVKVYSGNPTFEALPDGVTDDYVSTVTYTSNNSTVDPNYRASKGITLQDFRASNYDLTTNGNQNILVIPVKFTDTTEAIFDKYKYEVGGFDGMRKLIEQAFFGVTEDTGFESLSSYYYKSSYGGLNLTGKVTPWFTYPGTVQEFYDSGKGEASVYDLVDKATMWYKTNFDDYMKFDQNNDGYFDCVEFVYMQENCSSNSTGVCNKNKNTNAKELFWAFCWKRSGQEEMLNWPTAFTFAWFSFDFLLNDINNEYHEKIDGVDYYKADAHTVIHETGHALGLNDYYSTGYDGSTPAGKIDMMDNNVGDHNSYSKWALNWTKPVEQIVYDAKDETTKEYVVELRPFESSGDFAIIPAYSAEELSAEHVEEKGKLDSPLAEYLTVEYFTPTGLNEQDSKTQYENYGINVMTEAGVEMAHVDSRLAYLSYNNSAADYGFSDYLPVNADKNNVSFTATGNSYISYAHSNDAVEQNYDTGTDPDKDFRLIKAVCANETNELKLTAKGHCLSNADLFGSATSGINDFGVTNHQDFTFNNEFENLYNMEIISMDAEKVVLKFTYKGA